MKAAEDLAALKSEMRRGAKRARSALSHIERDQASAAAAQHAAGFLGDVRGLMVAGTAPIGSELDPRPCMTALADAGASLALPGSVEAGSPLTFYRWQDGDALSAGAFGVPAPPDTAEPVDPDIVLVPMLAFCRRCYRLGYGGGHYDRTLASLRQRQRVRAIGLAFAAQEVTDLPVEPHDVPLDVIITERETIAVTTVP